MAVYLDHVDYVQATVAVHWHLVHSVDYIQMAVHLPVVHAVDYYIQMAVHLVHAIDYDI